MIEKLKKNKSLFGLVFTVGVALFTTAMVWVALADPKNSSKMQKYLFDLGIDVIGALASAGLYYGCRKQEGEGTEAFRLLNIFVSAGFVVNFMLYFTGGVSGNTTAPFIFATLSKLIDLVMIYFFYHYVKSTLGFEGKLAMWADKGIPIMMAAEALVILSNIFWPVTFFFTGEGIYQSTEISIIEDIYLIVTSVITAILILRTRRPANQKVAGLTFIFLPLINYIMVGGTFGNASQYGMILVSLIIMYCIISIEKSTKLAATESELNMATRIQLDALPTFTPEFPDHPNVNLRATMHTAKEVGGDFFDYFAIDENRICFLIADVSGKGTPAALFMMTSKTMIKDYALNQSSTSEIFTSVNARLCENNEAGMFATSWIGILDTRTNILQYTNAGHNYPMIQRKGQPCEEIKINHGLFLGGIEFTRYKQDEIRMEPGDRLLLFTDGVVEAHDKGKNLYGNERLQQVLDGARDCPGEEVLDRIFEDVNVFATGVPQFDDITMVILTMK